MTDEPDAEEVEMDDPAVFPDVLSFDEGQVYFHPDLGSFCEDHSAKAVMVSHGTVWLLPTEGGKWYDVQDHGKSAVRTLKTVQ